SWLRYASSGQCPTRSRRNWPGPGGFPAPPRSTAERPSEASCLDDEMNESSEPRWRGTLGAFLSRRSNESGHATKRHCFGQDRGAREEALSFTGSCLAPICGCAPLLRRRTVKVPVNWGSGAETYSKDAVRGPQEKNCKFPQRMPNRT